MQKELADLVTSLGKIKKEAEECRGDMADPMDKKHQAMCDMIGSLADRLSYMAQAFWQYSDQHKNGHLPAVKTPSQMSHALEVLGLADDYEVYKPVLTVANRQGVQAVVEYRKPSK
jgi:hypothetical protein